MLLAIDAGNTQTVVGLYDGTALLDHWRIATSVERTSDEHALLIGEFLAMHGFSFEEGIRGVAISAGVPRLKTALREMTERYFGFEPVVIEPGVKTGMPILYDDPREVGADRIADAVAAYDLYGGPAIVVDFGTATVFDAVSGKGEYLGGAILPGIEISLDALFARAAGLRRVELVKPPAVIGRSTIESVQSGVINGLTCLVDGMVRLIEAELGESTVIATGGLAPLIAPLTSTIEYTEPWLTLHGLRLIHERNVSSS